MGDVLKNDLILFGDIKPDVYKLSNIYDPDSDFLLTSDVTFQSGVNYYTKTGTGTHVTYTLATVTVGATIPGNTYYVEGEGPTEQSGKFVPAVNSLVVDDTIGNGVYVLYVVHSVDEDTLKTTLRPIRLVEDDDDAPNRIVGYGNDVYMLYYDVRTSDIRLRLDRKLVFYGMRPSYYQLVKVDVDGNRTIISRVTNANNLTSATAVPIISVGSTTVTVSESNKSSIIGKTVQRITNKVVNGTYVASRETFVASATNLVNGTIVYILPETESLQYILKGDQCFAVKDTTFVDGELIYFEVYEAIEDLAGTVVYQKAMTLELVARHALTIDDMDISSMPIVDFDVELKDHPAEHELWTLGKDRLFSNLSYTPKLVYEDGTTHDVPVDNLCCFLYGAEDVDSGLVGREFKIMFKYWPSKNQVINWSRQQNQTAEGSMVCEKTVRIVDNVINSLAKLSVIPLWSSVRSEYTLLYYPYSMYQTRPVAQSGVRVDQNTFSGSNFTARQSFTVACDVLDENGNTTVYKQTVSILLHNYNNYLTETPWIIADQDSAFTTGSSYPTFGSNAAPHVRPVIKYDQATGMYFISATTFNSVAKFLENFYWNASPPAYNSDAEATSKAPIPTHFVLRDLADGLEKTVPIAIESYSSPFTILTTGITNQYVNSTMLMEFYQREDGMDRVIYGVPVEIRP